MKKQNQKLVLVLYVYKDIDRIDYQGGERDPTHIHFNDGRALGKDGTWKHNPTGDNNIPSKTAKWLVEHGFKLPK